MAIDPITAAAARIDAGGALTPRPAATPGGGFAESLHKLLSAVDQTSATANSAVAGMIEGTGDVHTAMIALQRAEMTLQFTVQVKNKLVQAYQDVMRMTV
jgi:flagellar hook-basal body complex protein FliE